MARPLRIEFPGALYHVTSRGDRREAIYRDDDDRRMHLRVIADALERSSARMLAWCLMGNHYHLVVQTQLPNLSWLMRQVNGVYTQAFNRRHGVTGHLFQGRFKAILVDRDAYLLALCRYVERNPVAAGLVNSAAAWPWSSCRAHLGVAPAPAWLDVDTLLGQLIGRAADTPGDRSRARKLYAEYIDDNRTAHARFSWDTALRRQIYAGNDHFIARVQSHASNERIGEREIPAPQRQAPLSLAQCLARTSYRDQAIVMAHREGGMTMTAIANELGLSTSRVSRVIAQAKAKGKT